MTAVVWIVAFLVAFVLLAYHRVSLKTATLTIAALLAACTLTSAGWGVGLLLWLVFLAVVIPLNVGVIRRPFITRPALNLFRTVLPTLSATERTALDAGTVWWEAEMFSGAPDWRRLDRMPEAELSTAEQAFLDGPVQQLLDYANSKMN